MYKLFQADDIKYNHIITIRLNFTVLVWFIRVRVYLGGFAGKSTSNRPHIRLGFFMIWAKRPQKRESLEQKFYREYPYYSMCLLAGYQVSEIFLFIGLSTGITQQPFASTLIFSIVPQLTKN